MIRTDLSTGTVELFVEKHRPTYSTLTMTVTRTLDSSTVYTTDNVAEDEFYFRASLDVSVLDANTQYTYQIKNKTWGNVYEQGIIFYDKKTNNDIIYGEG